MKHIALNIVMLLSSVLVWTGCDFLEGSDGLFSGTPSLTPRYLNVSPSSLSFAAAQPASQSVSVTSLKTPWRVDNSIEWITLSQTSGESSASVKVSVAENGNAYARTGIFMVSSTASDWNYDSDVSVSQAAAVPYITASQSALTLTGAAGSATIDVTANCTYSISSSVDWLSVTKSDNSLTLTATANESDQYRSGIVILSFSSAAGSASAKVTVTQAPASITASSETLLFENTAGEKQVEVSAEATWTASTSYSWIDVSPAAGAAGTSSLKVSVIPNTSTDERMGYVVLAIGSKQRIQIPVRQCGIYIETGTLSHDFGAAGETQTLQIRSNTDWQISSLPSWVKVDRDNGSGNAEIQVTAEENPYTTARSGQFVVSQPGLSLQAVVEVRQVGKTFDVAAATLYFGQKSGSQTLDITTDGTWRATTEADWIQIAPSSAKGNSVLSVSVSANDTETERTGEIVITMANASATIAVVQKGKYFTIDNPSLAFTSRGGQLAVSLATNVAWTARIEEGADWLSVTPASGDSLAEVMVTAADNPSVLDRTAHVYFDVLGRSVDLVVTQKGRYLTVDATELLFYAKGGISEVVTVFTDGDFAISASESWFTVTRSGDTFTVTAEENTARESRTGYITLALTDLAEGECSIKLPVRQSCTTGNDVLDNLVNNMVYVAGGTFTMGATSEQGSEARSDESPTHSVTLSSFSIGKYEVTQAEWKAVMGSNPSYFTGDDNLPVERVSQTDCQNFITKLNTLTRKNFRLPTEAEWEYAARGGNKSKGYKYAGSNTIDDVAWYVGNSESKTHAVGTKQPNELGLYDMSGNVREWCGDWWGDYSSSSQTNPTGANSGSGRVNRGGSWGNFARYCRSSSRNGSIPEYRGNGYGLRLVLSE
jgi:formylglycine-generating enzyme required for sulfatase activity